MCVLVDLKTRFPMEYTKRLALRLMWICVCVVFVGNGRCDGGYVKGVSCVGGGLHVSTSRGRSEVDLRMDESGVDPWRWLDWEWMVWCTSIPNALEMHGGKNQMRPQRKSQYKIEGIERRTSMHDRIRRIKSKICWLIDICVCVPTSMDRLLRSLRVCSGYADWDR